MLRIRFQRVGKKNQPFFRLVVIDKNRSPQGGRFEKLGFFNPLTKDKGLKEERIKYWLSVGAQPSDRVYNLLIEEKIIEGTKKSVHSRKKKGKGKEAEPTKTETAKTETAKTETTKTETTKEEVKRPVEKKASPEKKEEGKTDSSEEKTEIKKEKKSEEKNVSSKETKA